MENQNQDNKIIVCDDQGEQKECEILFTYQNPETGKNYVVLYAVNDLESEEEGDLDLFAYSFIEGEDGNGELFPLESDEEYELINDVIDQYFQDAEESEE